MNKVENSHWGKERWETEKQNVIRCLDETEEFVKTNKNIKDEKVNILTVEGLKIAMDKQKLLEKLESKKDYVKYLKNRLIEINKKIEVFNG